MCLEQVLLPTKMRRRRRKKKWTPERTPPQPPPSKRLCPDKVNAVTPPPPPLQWTWSSEASPPPSLSPEQQEQLLPHKEEEEPAFAEIGLHPPHFCEESRDNDVVGTRSSDSSSPPPRASSSASNPREQHSAAAATPREDSNRGEGGDSLSTSSMAPKAPKWLRRMPSASSGPAPPPPEGAVEAFVAFADADSFPDVLANFSKLLSLLRLEPGRVPDFYPRLKASLKEHVPFRYREIFKILTEKRKCKPYASGSACEAQRVLVTGAGPCGLRAAIEAQLLGAKVVLVEKRVDFTRHNILKLWKFLLADFKSLAVKKFIGKFCSGQINHVGIRTLQLFLAKVALILGVELICPCALVELVEPADGKGWKAKFSPEGTPADAFEFDAIVVASGKKVCVEGGFNRRSLDAKLSIAVTANFVNGGSREEAQVSQISGISRQYHQDFFKDMKSEVGIDLENIVYYRGETHYFVMTALRSSLIEKGVLLEDKEDRRALMSPSNVDRKRLHAFAIEAAQYSTGHFSRALPVTEFAMDARGRPDCAVFDFTNLYSARNACQVKVRRGHQLLLTIVGDSLLEPFWPEGTGCGRGVLSSLDSAWLLRQWAMARVNPLETLAERENIYKLLSQTSDGAAGGLKDNHKAYTINPSTRYRAIPKKIEHERILELYDTDAKEEFEFLKEKFVGKQFFDTKEYRTLLQRVRRGIAKQGGQVKKKLTRQRPAPSSSEQQQPTPVVA